MSLPLYQVDAFTDQPFRGNPAGVCLLDKPQPDAWLAGVAREMNLSETAFLLPEVDGYRLRWFTPGAEVDLCGHATLASAHMLYETGRIDPAAALRELANKGSPIFARARFIFSSSSWCIQASPTTVRLIFSLSRSGMLWMVFTCSVTFSPTTPSPRVAARTNKPSS